MRVGQFETEAFADADKLREVEREVEYRWLVYGRLVKAGKMREGEMNRRIALMIAVRDDLRARMKPEGRLL